MMTKNDGATMTMPLLSLSIAVGIIAVAFTLVLQNSNLHATMSEKPTPVVFCGPSGVGKGTLIEMLFKRFPNDQFGFSVSHTTRKPREGEVDGKHYHFTTVEDIKKEIDAGKFVEYAEVSEIWCTDARVGKGHTSTDPPGIFLAPFETPPLKGPWKLLWHQHCCSRVGTKGRQNLHSRH